MSVAQVFGKQTAPYSASIAHSHDAFLDRMADTGCHTVAAVGWEFHLLSFQHLQGTGPQNLYCNTVLGLEGHILDGYHRVLRLRTVVALPRMLLILDRTGLARWLGRRTFRMVDRRSIVLDGHHMDPLPSTSSDGGHAYAHQLRIAQFLRQARGNSA